MKHTPALLSLPSVMDASASSPSSRGRGGAVGERDAKSDQLVRAYLDTADEAAFEELHRRYRTVIQRICQRVTGNPQDAEDAEQDTFLVVYEKLSTFRFQSRFSSWIFRIAYNKSVELRRMRHRTNPLRRGYDASDPTGGLDSIVDARQRSIPDRLAEDENCERIADAVHSLSPRLREVAAMRYLDELSYKEIGERMSIPMGTVRSRLARARKSVPIANAG